MQSSAAVPVHLSERYSRCVLSIQKQQARAHASKQQKAKFETEVRYNHVALLVPAAIFEHIADIITSLSVAMG